MQLPSFLSRAPPPRHVLTPSPSNPSSPYTSPQPHSRLFALPPELLHKILLLLAGSRSIILELSPSEVLQRETKLLDHDEPHNAARRAPNDVRGWETGALCACRALYAALLPLLHAALRIEAWSAQVVAQLPRLLPEGHGERIRSVVVFTRWSIPPLVPGGKVLYGISGGKGTQRGVWGSLNQTAEGLKGLRGLREVRWVFVVPMGWDLYWREREAEVRGLVEWARDGRDGWTMEMSWERPEGVEDEEEGDGSEGRMKIVRHLN